MSTQMLNVLTTRKLTSLMNALIGEIEWCGEEHIWKDTFWLADDRVTPREFADRASRQDLCNYFRELTTYQSGTLRASVPVAFALALSRVNIQLQKLLDTVQDQV